VSKQYLKVKSHVEGERHFLTNARCSEDCGKWWPDNISPTTWAQQHTLETGHETQIRSEKIWYEVIDKVEEVNA
jgi:hypothetical protein